jgi:hypothetical protein
MDFFDWLKLAFWSVLIIVVFVIVFVFAQLSFWIHEAYWNQAADVCDSGVCTPI